MDTILPKCVCIWQIYRCFNGTGYYEASLALNFACKACIVAPMIKNIRKNTYVLSIALFSLVASSAISETIPLASTWQKGELLSYKVYFGMLKAGKATIEYREEASTADESAETFPRRYSITVKAKTSGLAKSLFKLNDTIGIKGYTNNVQTFPYQPYAYNLTLSEGKYRANKDITFDFNKATLAGTATFRNMLKPELEPEVFDVESKTRDVLSAMYFLRNSVKATDIKVGDVYTLPIYGTKSQYKMDVIVTEEREMKTSYKHKTLKLWHIEPQKSSNNEKFNGKESKPWGVWVTQDADLTPINIDVHLKSGTFKARLNKIWPL
jgi:hypothetical protein